MVKTSLLLLAILASANGELNEVPACAYTGISTSCQDYISAGFGMVNWNSNNQKVLDEGICAAYDDGLCAQECTEQDMDGCSSVTGSTGAICFTGDSLLTLDDGSTKKFRDLEVSCETVKHTKEKGRGRAKEATIKKITLVEFF